MKTPPFFLCLASCAFTANAATYYVAKTGNDGNPGTDPGHSKFTIQAQNQDMVTIDANKANRCAALGTVSSHKSTKLTGIILTNGNADHPNVTVQKTTPAE